MRTIMIGVLVAGAVCAALLYSAARRMGEIDAEAEGEIPVA